MNEVFRKFLHRFVIVYIDDILIYSRNLAEHHQHIQQVLHKLRDHSLYLKLEKGEFHRSSVQFLGYIISAEGLSITAPLTSLLRGKPKTLCWNPSAHEAFHQLKKIFDASTTGVGAVLSQAVSDPPLLHPCAYNSRKLSPAEQNYDVGNRELLVIKLALEEWRHWLEGSKHPFTIITDHKNLQYIHEAKRLNPRQARWALFFTRFNFKITYRPGSKNIPADTLSRLHSTDQPVEPEPILPSNLIVSPIIWDINNDIHNATLQEAAPPECQEGKIFVPPALRQDLLGAAHQFLGSGHPGSQRTLSLLQSRYWWPSMRRDTISLYVGVLTVTSMSVHRYHNVIKSRVTNRMILQRLERRHRCLQLIAIWILAFAFTLPVYFVQGLGLDKDGLKTCTRTAMKSQSVKVTVLLFEILLGFVIPFLTMLTCYLWLHKGLSQKAKNSNLTTAPQDQKPRNQGTNVGTYKKRLVISIVVAFFVFWTPVHIINVINIVTTLTKTSLPDVHCQLKSFRQRYSDTNKAVALLNCCLNPFLYAISSGNMKCFRKR
ncbi:Transposon Tf2-9 polyprotein [Labeo rohita]|uniref:ribonuclease H n=1 Tax=Labeo rohita TaxID=84645 RepID=A0ABQ8LSG3_LABRO|nr:Transposon Tf2-9 polyprotein [Labeo rohita]